MATLANLTVALTARTAAFQRGMTRAAGIVNQFGSHMRRVGGFLAKWGGVLAGVAVGGLSLMVRQAFKAIDATAKLGDALGLTTQQLVGYKLAAQIAGVESSQLTTALQRMEKNISDAVIGLTTAKRAFATLGLSAEHLRTLSPDEAFKVIADSLGNVQHQADKARVVLDLLGRSGLGVIKMLEMGRSGLEGYQKEAERLGLAFDRISAAKIEIANDALTRMRGAVRGITDHLAIQLAPVVTAIADRVRNFTLRLRESQTAGIDAFELISKAASGFADVLFHVQGFVKSFQLVLGAAFVPIVALLQEAAKIAHFFADPLAAAGGRGVWTIEHVADAWLEQLRRIDRELTAFAQQDRPSKRITAYFAGLREAAENAARISITEKAGGPSVDLAALDEAARRIERLRDRAVSVFEQTRTPIERFWASFNELGTLLRQQLITWDTYGRAVGKAREQLLGTATAMQQIGATAAIEMGTAEAFRAERVHRMGARIDTMPADIHAALLEAKRQTTMLERHNQLLVDLNAPARAEVLQ